MHKTAVKFRELDCSALSSLLTLPWSATVVNLPPGTRDDALSSLYIPSTPAQLSEWEPDTDEQSSLTRERNSGLGTNHQPLTLLFQQPSGLKMEPLNSTHPSTAASSRPLQSHVPSSGSGSGNEYFYVLVVMSFYGIFLIGIMLGYMKSKRREKKSSLLLLYKDEDRLWGEAMKPLPVVSSLRSVQVPMMLNMLQDSVGPALSCTLCSMEGDSVSSESSSPDVHLTIQEEGADDELEETSETPLNESSEGSSENIHQNS
ncbi:Potassium voltage-gated channel subfamily E member 4 [Heterocephalus glaber]|uniref:Potassium voltage-gated channel subfamily E member 4 n=1 Tax=Heterocephalus glaber TaxID=10181 RepID=G5B856_HETGA|nr:Potassium voltage-gated channel subfamily E member 4 [Heterocephalus glaber]